MTEIEAKVSYVKLARSLKTYGVSFFLVKVRKFLSVSSSVYGYCCRMMIGWSIHLQLLMPLICSKWYGQVNTSISMLYEFKPALFYFSQQNQHLFSSFLQEKMKGKNKLVPRLLGITKESVMRVDEKTKEVIQEWNLTNIKRWAASPKSFTLVSFSWK